MASSPPWYHSTHPPLAQIMLSRSYSIIMLCIVTQPIITSYSTLPCYYKVSNNSQRDWSTPKTRSISFQNSVVLQKPRPLYTFRDWRLSSQMWTMKSAYYDVMQYDGICSSYFMDILFWLYAFLSYVLAYPLISLCFSCQNFLKINGYGGLVKYYMKTFGPTLQFLF